MANNCVVRGSSPQSWLVSFLLLVAVEPHDDSVHRRLSCFQSGRTVRQCIDENAIAVHGGVRQRDLARAPVFAFPEGSRRPSVALSAKSGRLQSLRIKLPSSQYTRSV